MYLFQSFSTPFTSLGWLFHFAIWAVDFVQICTESSYPSSSTIQVPTRITCFLSHKYSYFLFHTLFKYPDGFCTFWHQHWVPVHICTGSQPELYPLMQIWNMSPYPRKRCFFIYKITNWVVVYVLYPFLHMCGLCSLNPEHVADLHYSNSLGPTRISTI